MTNRIRRVVSANLVNLYGDDRMGSVFEKDCYRLTVFISRFQYVLTQGTDTCVNGLP
jgi:hypothetical protein